MGILDYIERIKRENEGPRITAQEPRIGLKPGGLVEPGVVNYGKATMDDPLHNIKKGEELGKSVKQIVSKKNKVIGYQAFTKEPYYISNTEKNAFQRVKDYANEFRSPMAGTLKKGITKYTASAMFQDSDFEEFFKKYLNKREGYVKDFKGNADKLSLDDLKKEWDKIKPLYKKQIVNRPWNTFKSRTKVSFLSEIAEHLPYSEVTLKNYLADSKRTLPENITENLSEFYKITQSRKIVDQLKELDLLPENYETAKSGEKYTWRKLTDADKEKLKNVKTTRSLDPDPTKRAIVTKAAKKELLPEQRSINAARRALITETNKQLKDLLKTKPHQLRLFIANNPVIKEIVETEIRAGNLLRTPINTLTDKELYERVRLTEDHVKDFNKTKIDAYGKVLTGKGIEDPGNLRIMLRQQNHPLKRVGSEFVELNINSKDLKIKNQIKNIENFFRRTGQAFLTGEFETGTIKGATGNISLEKQFKNLGLDVTKILDASKLKAKLIQNLIDLCRKGGTPTVACGMDQLTKYLKNGVPKTEKTLVARILGIGNKLIKGAGQMLNPVEFFKLKNWVSAPALAAFGLFETGFVADDVLRKNKPLNEAAADNWLTGMMFNLDSQVEQAKNILGSNKHQLSPAAKEYAQSLIDVKRHDDLSARVGALDPEIKANVKSEMATIRHNVRHRGETGRFDYESALADKIDAASAGEYVGEPVKRDLMPGWWAKDADDEWRKVNEVGYAIKGASFDAPDKPGLPSFTSGFASAAKNIGKGKALISAQTKKQFVPGEYVQKKGQLPEPKVIDVPAYVSETFKPDLPTKENLNRLFQLLGVAHPRFGQVPEETLDLMIKQEKWRQLMERPEMKGSQERLATGGIANLTTTVARDSGPMQGLASTPEYDTYRKEYKWQT